jgi:hypothetical protein
MDHFQDVNDIYVLTNKPGRVYLEFGENSRAFDNVWQTNGIFIFKSQCPVFFFFPFADIFSGICGRIEGEGIVGAPIQGRSCRWCRVAPLPSQHQVESDMDLPNPPFTATSTTDTSAWVPVEDWRETISHVLHSHDTKIRIEIITEPVQAVPSRSFEGGALLFATY